MKEVVIIGAGQLGSRHLQGVLKSKSQMKVYVVDPNEDSLAISKTRANEVEHSHQLIFNSAIDQLPSVLEVVIIATNANVRAKVVRDLLVSREVKTLVLEKVLFQTIEDYEEIGQLLNDKKVQTFVNHPRRMQQFYKQLHATLLGQNMSDISIHVYGQNWGLGCNGLHILDLISYLTSDEIVDLQTNQLDRKIIASKRKGFIEFSGVLNGNLSKGGKLSITSVFNESEIVEPLTITIATPSIRFVVQEGAKTTVTTIDKLHQYVPEEEAYTMLFQSDLTTHLIDAIKDGEPCSLPTYNEARINHELFIHKFLDFYNEVTQNNTEICPIT